MCVCYTSLSLSSVTDRAATAPNLVVTFGANLAGGHNSMAGDLVY